MKKVLKHKLHAYISRVFRTLRQDNPYQKYFAEIENLERVKTKSQKIDQKIFDFLDVKKILLSISRDFQKFVEFVLCWRKQKNFRFSRCQKNFIVDQWGFPKICGICPLLEKTNENSRDDTVTFSRVDFRAKLSTCSIPQVKGPFGRFQKQRY